MLNVNDALPATLPPSLNKISVVAPGATMLPLMLANSVPPTYKFPATPAPPETTNAPVDVLVDTVVVLI